MHRVRPKVTKSEEGRVNMELLKTGRIVGVAEASPKSLAGIGIYMGISSRVSIKHKLRRHDTAEFLLFHDDRPPIYPLTVAYMTSYKEIRYYPIKVITDRGSTLFYVSCAEAIRVVKKPTIAKLMEYHKIYAFLGPPFDTFQWWVDDKKYPTGHRSLMNVIPSEVSVSSPHGLSDIEQRNRRLQQDSAQISSPQTVTISDVPKESLVFVTRYIGVQCRREVERMLVKRTDFLLYHLDHSPHYPLLVAYKTRLGEFRHYPIKKRANVYFVDCSEPKCASFSSIQRLLHYHETYGYLQMTPYMGHPTVDTFPWWLDDAKYPNGRSFITDLI